ncbi:MAG: hypothetical protein WAO58_02460 [Fimbriimonadaceae bacterium]
MNGKFEEELLQAAFGDLSDEEIARVEREALEDPVAAKAYASYREMRDGLKSLRDVPDHQLSTERLRHAILGQGLKPSRQGWQFGWLMPIGALAVGLFAFYALDFRRTSTPEIAAIGDKAGSTVANVVDTNSGIESIVEEFNPNLDVANPESYDGTVSADVPRSSAKRVAPRSSGRRDFVIRVSPEPYGPVPDVQPSAPSANLASSGPSGRDAFGGGGQEAAESGIVVIEAERDGLTGANRATEVDSSRNVVIGG